MKKLIALLTLAIVLLPISAYADSITASPGVVPLHGNTDITLSVDVEREVTFIAVLDPAGTIVTSSVVDPSIPLPTIPAGGSYTWNLNDDLGVIPDMIGNWQIVIDTANGTPIYIDFAVSFFVVPESAIGALAIIGSSMAALATYMLRKRIS